MRNELNKPATDPLKKDVLPAVMEEKGKLPRNCKEHITAGEQRGCYSVNSLVAVRDFPVLTPS